MLIKICKLLGLSADYVLFGETRSEDVILLENLHRLDDQYIPMVQDMLDHLLALSGKENEERNG